MIKISSTGKKILLAIKLALTAFLVYGIIRKLDWQELKVALKHADIYLLQLAFIIMFLCFVVSAYKWQVLLQVHKIIIKYNKLLNYYLIGFFFNNFLPTNIGGDSYRLYKTYNNNKTKSGAVLAIFTERLTGVLALLIIGFIGGFFSFLSNKNDISLNYLKWIGYLSAVTIPALIVLLLFYKKIAAFLKMHLPSKIVLFLEHIKDYTKDSKRVSIAIMLSFIFQLMIMFSRYLIILAVGAQINFLDLTLIVAVATLVALLPLTINGYGLMDGAYIYLLNNFGVQFEEATLVMLFIRAFNLLLSLIGGLAYLRLKKTEPNTELQFQNKLT